jgi:hypothetical protein
VDKLVTYWRASSLPDGAIAPWEQLDAAPAAMDGLHGELKIEDVDEVVMVYFADEIASEKITRAELDADALTEEWGIPYKPTV